MKITRLGQATPLLSATSLGGSGGTLDPVVGGGLVPVASGSNSWSWGSNVSLITANGSNAVLGPLVNFAAGSNITLSVSSNTLTITSAAGGGSTSYGSNSNAVASANDGGASTLASRADHVHLGVRSLAHSSNSFSGPVILTASGTLGITSPTPGTYNLSAGTGGGGGSALTVKDEGVALATDATSLDFVGAGVVASGAGATKTITIAGGSGSGALVLLEQKTASASAQLDFTTFISSTYDTYKIEGIDIVAATSAADLQLQIGTGGGPTYDTGNTYTWGRLGYRASAATDNDAGSTGIARIFKSMDISAGFGFGTFSLTASGLQSTALRKSFHGTLAYVTSVSTEIIYATFGMHWITAGTAVTALRFVMSSGNIASGTIRIYGLTK